MLRRALQFPDRFVWGAATAAYQIEGAVAEDGRGPSIWDTFSKTPGRILDGSSGEVACDHYHRYREDVALMADIGLQSYRFSVAWPRVIPEGRGRINVKGLDFYSRLVDALLDRGISPLVTLYHWDLPQPLQDDGGWNNRETAQRFADFATVVAEALADRVPTFTTLNEPRCAALLGYGTGAQAPGIQDTAAALNAAHHLLLAHGLASQALRVVLPPTAQLSITNLLTPIRPATDTPEDVDAARRADAISNRLFLDPVLKGYYPEDLVADTAQVTDWSFVLGGDLETIHQRPDVLGVNFYQPSRVGAAPPVDAVGPPLLWQATADVYVWPQPGPCTVMGWHIEPQALTDLLVLLDRDYPETPILITENGAAFVDTVSADGAVHDNDRVAYIHGHLAAVHAAIEAGVDVRGFTYWSLMDNFEWAFGYGPRFGLIRVDYETQQRTLKDSAIFYRDVIRQNGLGL